MTDKKDSDYKTIGEVAKILNLIDLKTGRSFTHTIRFWEKEFRQIKPKIFSGRRRYYNQETINLLKKIKFLLKERGMTIKGVKKILNDNDNNLDEINNISINTKENIKSKLRKISGLIEEIKKN
tara:strand:+ start:1506 stop:1877 length:372 start_codon:yes stop_codon:yes gene_type:complete